MGVTAAKQVLNRTKDLVLQPGLELEADFWAGLSATRDMKEGARAFIEKRKPTWESK